MAPHGRPFTRHRHSLRRASHGRAHAAGHQSLHVYVCACEYMAGGRGDRERTGEARRRWRKESGPACSSPRSPTAPTTPRLRSPPHARATAAARSARMVASAAPHRELRPLHGHASSMARAGRTVYAAVRERQVAHRAQLVERLVAGGAAARARAAAAAKGRGARGLHFHECDRMSAGGRGDIAVA
jgi:hypothetical protein